MILWKGHCSVHTRFTVAQIEAMRRQHPGIRVIVHPEVPWDVVQAADDSGSTEYIIKTVATARSDRSGPSAPKSISSTGSLSSWRPTAPCSRSISSAACARRCSACRRITCSGFSKSWSKGRVHNRIVVPDEQKHWNARRARPDAVDSLGGVMGQAGLAPLVRQDRPCRCARRGLHDPLS